MLACEAAFKLRYCAIPFRGSPPTQPLPMCKNTPRLVFEKLFGVGATDAERTARPRSLLDCGHGSGSLRCRRICPPAIGGGGPVSRKDVREIERRIQRAEASVRADITLPEVPTGVPATFHSAADGFCR